MKKDYLLILFISLLLSMHVTNASASKCENGKSSIECIRQRGFIIAGTAGDAQPFGFVDKNGIHSGFDVDILKAFSQCWFGDDSEQSLKILQINSADRRPALVNREVDIVAHSMTYTYDRDKFIDFSNIYFVDGQKILVRKESDMAKQIKPSDGFVNISRFLNNKIVAAVETTTSMDNIKKKSEEFNINTEFINTVTWDEAVDMLKNGKVHAVTTDGVILEGYAKGHEDLVVVGAAFSDEPYAIGIHEGDSPLRRLINITLQNIWESGEYQKIFRKWFPDQVAWPLYQLDTFSGSTDMSPFKNECRKIKKKEIECQIYTVKPGDSLSAIASRFYSSPNKYSDIYHNNKDVIGPNPHLIEAGIKLNICPSF